MGLYPLLIALPLWMQQQSLEIRLANQDYAMEQLCTSYQEEIQTLTDSLEIYRASLDSLWDMHPYFNEESLVKLYSFVDKYEYCPGTRFITKSSVNPEMDKDLYKALSTYTGPPATITSLYRPHSHGSRHKTKRAVDIRWNENGKLMAEWLLTEEGSKWMTQNNLKIYLENVPETKYRKGVFEEFYMWNPKATGPHIHISLENEREISTT